tara:strand:- start:423 stop:764 length:342 start_codon:yes stop_codon:yes gene_type:complete
MKEDEKDIKVSPAILEVIKKAAKPMAYRLDALLESHYNGSMKYSEIDLMALLEYRASAQILYVLLEEYMDIDSSPGEEKILMPFEHFTLIATTSKTIESAYRSLVGNTPLWTH